MKLEVTKRCVASESKGITEMALSISLVFMHPWESGRYFKTGFLSPPPPLHPRLCAVMEQERISTYLNNSKTKREATNDVKIVVNPICQAFNTTCGVYLRRSFCFLRRKQGLDYLVWDYEKTKLGIVPSAVKTQYRLWTLESYKCNLIYFIRSEINTIYTET